MRYVIVHAGRRDDYQVALALAESNKLLYLITDIYFPLDKHYFNKISSFLKLKSKFEKRYKKGLPSNKVIISKRALIYSVFYKIFKNIRFSTLKDKELGNKANRIALKHNSSVISMNTYASEAFNKIEKLKILFQFHPHLNFVKNVFDDEIFLNPKSEISLKREYEYSVSKEVSNKLSKEIFLADEIICASTVTKKSLIFEGINSDKIKVIPYGVDFINKKRIVNNNDENFKILFVGSLNQRKGITYLLKALEKMENLSLTIVGRGIFDLELVEGYSTNVIIKKNISKEELNKEFVNADCFVLPSIIEGFGQVILEAMSFGIPVIASENTIAPDIIENGKNGLIFKIRDFETLKSHILKLKNNKDLSYNIGQSGQKVASELTWQKFRKDFIFYISGLEVKYDNESK